MLLESGKIYKRKYFADSYMLPTLEITGSAQVYVSNKGEKPTSTSDMKLEDGFENNKINTVIAMTRWICVVYEESSDESNAVYDTEKLDVIIDENIKKATLKSQKERLP